MFVYLNRYMGDCLSSRKAEDIQKDINIRKLFSNSQVIQKPEIKKLKKKRRKDKSKNFKSKKFRQKYSTKLN